MEAACSREPVPNASGSVSAGEVQSPGSCFSLGSTPPARTPRQATGPGHANRTDADATPSEQFSLGSTPSEQFSLGSTPGAMSAASAASPAPQLRTPDPAVDLGHEAHILSDIMRELDAEDEAAEEEEDALRMFSMEPGAAPSGGTTGPKDQLHQSAHDLEAEFGIDELYSEHCESCAEDEPGAAAHALVTGFPHSLGVQSDACHQHSNKESVLALADVPKQAGTLAGLYEGFVCKCTRGLRQGGSCIQDLKVSQLKQARCLLEPPRKSSSSGAPTHARTKLHELMWAMKAPLARPNYRGHNFKIPKWTYDGTVLCRHGWMKLVGGSYQAHRDMYSLVLRGLSPHEIDCAKGAALLEKCAAQVQGDLTEKQSYTTAWIQNVYLATMEYMPNENRIVLRGVGTPEVHKTLYSPAAELAKMRLSYKRWMKCMKPAAVLTAAANGSPEEHAAQVKVSRSARHSKFPNCTNCHEYRTDYITLASDPLAPPWKVAAALKKWLDHQNQFMSDRLTARRLRAAATLPDSTARYECDDKCGSHWCKCPVTVGGRDSKHTSTRNYEFAVQANVVCGQAGVMRLAIVPKTVSTGANFGLSTLLLALWSACCSKGKLPRSVSRVYRHTDGGPDNVASLTHIFHWLVVYLGCWQDFWWFMFDAGHSHTEIADRLFALMKQLFETDSAASVRGGIFSFEELEDKLKQTFHKCPEMKEIVYHFANWNIDDWLKANIHFKKDDLKGFSFDKVYRYEYVADAPCKDASGKPSNMAIVHGGVKVTYKKHLSDTKISALEDEWLPIETVSEPTAASLGQQSANRTTAEGLLFVKSPPNMTSEPPREAIASK